MIVLPAHEADPEGFILAPYPTQVLPDRDPTLKGAKYRKKNHSSAGLRIRIHFIRIRIQYFRMNTNLDPDPIRIQDLNDQKLKKMKQKKGRIYSGSVSYPSSFRIGIRP